MLSTVLYYELAMKVPIPVGITVYLLTWGLGHLRCLVPLNLCQFPPVGLYFLVMPFIFLWCPLFFVVSFILHDVFSFLALSFLSSPCPFLSSPCPPISLVVSSSQLGSILPLRPARQSSPGRGRWTGLPQHSYKPYIPTVIGHQTVENARFTVKRDHKGCLNSPFSRLYPPQDLLRSGSNVL